MFMSDTSALFATQVAALATDGAWSALPDAPIVDDSRAITPWRTVAHRVRQVLPRRRQTSDPCATPVLR